MEMLIINLYETNSWLHRVISADSLIGIFQIGQEDKRCASAVQCPYVPVARAPKCQYYCSRQHILPANKIVSRSRRHGIVLGSCQSVAQGRGFIACATNTCPKLFAY